MTWKLEHLGSEVGGEGFDGTVHRWRLTRLLHHHRDVGIGVNRLLEEGRDVPMWAKASARAAAERIAELDDPVAGLWVVTQDGVVDPQGIRYLLVEPG